ncbi:unnamed protein product [Amoebophrya sp. A25]|nr:unnamed protein product [Amoebophrya sp. A25]|eukprot:GSA25T00004759001.1
MPKMDCVDCGKGISGTYFDTDNGPQCQACAEKSAGVCVVCNKTMLDGGPGLTIGGGLSVHQSCFQCCECKEGIEGGFMEKRKLLTDKEKDPRWNTTKETDWMCGACADKFQRDEWEKKHPPKGGSKAANKGGPGAKAADDACTFCGKALEPGQKIGKLGDGSKFHSDCFRCKTCDEPIKGQFIKGADGGITCTNCIPKCAGCGGKLSGQIMTAGGRQYHKAGPDGHCCFKCSHCTQPLDHGFYPDPAAKARGESDIKDMVCEGCYAEITENVANAKHKEAEAKELKETAEIERGHACVWSDAYRGRAEDTLHLFDSNDKEDLKKDPEHLCLFLDEDSHLHVGKAHDPKHSINLEYLVEACKMIELNHGQEPVFSLDPADPHDLGGAEQKKRFIPDEMCDGPLGEVMFQADYFLKKFSFGDAPVEGVKFDSLFETDHSSTGARQWFIIDSGSVTLSKDRVLIVDVKMKVDARRLEMGPDGYRDAPTTDESDPAMQHARNFSANMQKLREKVASVHELFECAKALTLAKWLIKKQKLHINKEDVLKYQPRSIVHEMNMVKKTTCKSAEGRKPFANGYPRLIPTLRKEQKRTNVHHKEKGGGIEIEEHTQSMYGGVDLGVPVEKIEEKPPLPIPVADPEVKPQSFPVLQPIGAYMGTKAKAKALDLDQYDSMKNHSDFMHAHKSHEHNKPVARLSAAMQEQDRRSGGSTSQAERMSGGSTGSQAEIRMSGMSNASGGGAAPADEERIPSSKASAAGNANLPSSTHSPGPQANIRSTGGSRGPSSGGSAPASSAGAEQQMRSSAGGTRGGSRETANKTSTGSTASAGKNSRDKARHQTNRPVISRI